MNRHNPLLRLSYLIIILITGFVFNSCKSNKSKTDIQEDCSFNTSGDPKANGVNMEVFYPCTWIDLHRHDSISTLAKQFALIPKYGDLNIVLMVLISPEQKKLTDVEFEKSYLADDPKTPKEVISSDSLLIDGIMAGEFITKVVLPDQVIYQYFIHFYIKENRVQLIYSVDAPTQTAAHEIFERKKSLFIDLASKTKIPV